MIFEIIHKTAEIITHYITEQPLYAIPVLLALIFIFYYLIKIYIMLDRYEKRIKSKQKDK